jgi:hypothetical protein
VRRRLDDAVEEVADAELLGPMAEVRGDARRFCAAVRRAGS